MYLNKSLIRVLLFFYLFSASLSATHIHHDMTQAHDDCKVCIITKNLHSTDAPASYHFEAAYFSPIPIRTCIAQTYSYSYNKYTSSQAPPHFFL